MDGHDLMEQDTTNHTDMEKRISILTRLMDVSAQINSTVQLDTLLATLMDTAAEITGSESASVLLWNHNTRELFFAATTSDSPVELIGKPVPLEGSIAGTIMQERRMVQVDDVSEDPRHFQGIGEESSFVTRSILGVPMTSKNRLIGVLEVINKRELPWTEDDGYYLTALAGQAAIAIESAQLVSQLKRANEELSQVDKLKNDFIALASHELRTPLGVIMGYASFLQEETASNPAASGHIEKVMNSALKLRKIIEDLTNLRYLQQNAADLQLMPISVEDLLKDVRFDMITLLEAKGQRLQIIPVDPELEVNVDRARIAMAITNIMVNAVEFTPSNDRIIIETEKRPGEVWIRITDHGVGIEKDQLDRIFEKFYQVENHMTRHHEGLGIGLSISKALVLAHGGRIFAASEGIGHGATFTVCLPLMEASDESA
ncbi:MAG: GAF domain-containing sensor histidine kinase [Chloroflexota bacterium]